MRRTRCFSNPLASIGQRAPSCSRAPPGRRRAHARRRRAVGASKGLIKTTELLIKHQREDEWEKMWDEELDQDTKEAFKEWIKAGMPKAKTGKIPRQSISDLDRMDRYVHPWDKHCQEQDEIPF